jgi:hypothetical protein
MKHIYSGIIFLMLTAAGITARAEVTGNVGWDSEYIFRGISQSNSSANGGIDWEGDRGFYLGVWAADVDEGLEIDYYGGFKGQAGDFGYTIGATYYDYTDDFDDTYREINLGVSRKWLSLDVAIGEYDNFDGPTLNYEYYELTAERNGFFATVGSFHNDFDGEYGKAGYGTEIFGIDVTGYYVYGNKDLLGPDGSSDQSLVVQLNKAFTFRQVADAWNGVTNQVVK